MTYNPGYSVGLPDPVPEDGVFLLPLCLTEQELLTILEAVELGGLALGYGRQGAHITPFWQALEFLNEPTATPCAETLTDTEKQDVSEIAQTYLQGLIDCHDDEYESEDDEMALQIQTIDGVDYLVENCCGGATKFYTLTGVVLDANGTPIAPVNSGIGIGADSGDSGAWDFGGITGNPQDCYAESATNYLMSRAIEFAHAVIDFASVGLDAVTNLDEYVEVAVLVSKLLFGTGDIPAIQALTKSAVSDALTDSATVTPLAAAWNYTGRITKNDLRDWVNNAPWVVDSVPVRMILHEWITDSWLIGISKDLARLASECESGNVTPTTPEVIGASWYVDMNFVTTGDTLGWGGGDAPEGTAKGLFDATGWRPNTVGALEAQIGIKYVDALEVTAIRVHLNTPMTGAASEMRVRMHPVGGYDDFDSFQGINPMFMMITEQEWNLLQIEVQNQAGATDMTAWRIERVEMWGINEPPENGNVIIL